MLPLENTKARHPISQAIIEQRAAANDCVLNKICLPNEEPLKQVTSVDCTRGFYAIAFALQARNRRGVTSPVRCIGFGRRGHEGDTTWQIGHNHDEEMRLWVEMWKHGTDLSHLEWDDFSEEILATVVAHPKKFIAESVRMTSPTIDPKEMKKTLETDLENVQACILMASKSKWYKDIPCEKLEEMATHGLIINPEDPEYLTCNHHQRKGRYMIFQDAQKLVGHFSVKHKENFTEWRCAHAGPKPIQESEEIEKAELLPILKMMFGEHMAMPSAPMASASSSSLPGVWADPVEPEIPPPMLREHMAMPSAPMASASSSSLQQSRPFNVFKKQEDWHWMIKYARFQCVAQKILDMDPIEDDIFHNCGKKHYTN